MSFCDKNSPRAKWLYTTSGTTCLNSGYLLQNNLTAVHSFRGAKKEASSAEPLEGSSNCSLMNVLKPFPKKIFGQLA